MQNEFDYLRRLGSRLLSEANDLKRTPEALAQDLGWISAEVKAVLAGERDRAIAERLACDMAAFYPISLRDVWVDTDDTDEGVRLMEARASAASAPQKRHFWKNALAQTISATRGRSGAGYN